MLPKPKEQRKLPCRLVAQTGEQRQSSQVKVNYTLGILYAYLAPRIWEVQPVNIRALLQFRMHLSYTGENGLLWPSLGKTSLD